MSCQPFAAALVDEPALAPPGLEEHLAHCEDCRALARLHASARRLRLAEPPPSPTPFTPEAIRGVVRRRRRRRAVVAGVGAAGAAALLLLALRTPEATVAPATELIAQGSGTPVEGVVLRAESGASVSSETPVDSSTNSPTNSAASASETGSLLAELMSEVAGYTRTHPAVEDRAYETFGLLALWIRPPESTALDAEPFRSALWAFQPRSR